VRKGVIDCVDVFEHPAGLPPRLALRGAKALQAIVDRQARLSAGNRDLAAKPLMLGIA
jgi:hypothetical protein